MKAFPVLRFSSPLNESRLLAGLVEGERRLEAENVKFPLNNNDFDVGGSCLLVDLSGCHRCHRRLRRLGTASFGECTIRFVYWVANNFQLIIPG